MTPQWRVGAFRIDLWSSKGMARRLAIECDGDRYHPLEKLPGDMDRQSVLERMGWIYSRASAARKVLPQSGARDETGVLKSSSFWKFPPTARGLLPRLPQNREASAGHHRRGYPPGRGTAAADARDRTRANLRSAACDLAGGRKGSSVVRSGVLGVSSRRILWRVKRAIFFQWFDCEPAVRK